MISLDITYCSNLKCKNKNCERNQKHLEEIQKECLLYHYISIAEFKKCEFWEGKNE